MIPVNDGGQSAGGAENAATSEEPRMQPHPLAKFFWSKLVRFGQIWGGLSKSIRFR